MLVFAAITPHAPLLIPTVGKKHALKLKKTSEAMKKLEEELYVSRPDTIVIISPHGAALPDAFTINLSASYTVSFKEFGDHKTETTFNSDFMLIDAIQRSLRHTTQLVLSSSEILDYGTAIPLFLLSEHLKTAAVVPIIISGLNYKAHFDFGDKLKEEIMGTNKRVAVIASTDLSHTLSNAAPGGFSKEGAELDKKVVELLTSKNTAGFLALDPTMSAASKECGVRSIMTLLGLLSRVNFEPKIHSYEGPFGVGYLVANLVLA